MAKVKGKYDLSYWERSTFFDNIDVAVIGSGIVGLSCAIHLKEKHPFLKVVILERGPLPIGASTRNAGFACFGSVTELLDDLEQHGEDLVWQLVEKRYRGLQELRKKYGEKSLRFHSWGGYELFRNHEDETSYDQAWSQLPYLNSTLKNITGLEATFLPADHKINEFGFSGIKHLILNQAEGQLNTGQLMKTLLHHAQHLGITIFNGIKVKSLQEEGTYNTIITNKDWTIHCKKAVIATNGFAHQLLGNLDIFPARNQVLITTPINNLRIKGTFHYDRGYFYFRNIDNRVLIGGGRNLAMEKEKTEVLGTTPFIQAVLIKILKDYIVPEQTFEIDHSWSGIMGLGAEKTPIVRQLSEHTFVSIRLGGMGVAIGNLIGTEVAELVLASL